jgi:hypothetical protein
VSDEPDELSEDGRPVRTKGKAVLIHWDREFLRRIDRAWRRMQYGNRLVFIRECVRKAVVEEEERQRQRRIDRDDFGDMRAEVPRPMSATRPGHALREDKPPDPPSPPSITVLAPDAVSSTAESLAAFVLAAGDDAADREMRVGIVEQVLLAQPNKTTREAIARRLDEVLGSTGEADPAPKRDAWMPDTSPPKTKGPDPVARVNDMLEELFGSPRKDSGK